MSLFEGKTPSERNKIIAAAVLGVLALGSLWFAFGASLTGGSSTSVTVKVSPTPRAGSSPRRELGPVEMPSQAEQNLGYMIPVSYIPGSFQAPPPGRNIFAFYEPPPPCPECPTPTPKPPPPTPAPTPTPPFPYELAMVSPQNVYAGTRAFRIEVGGERFGPEAKIVFNGTPLETSFVNEGRLAANVPANLVAREGNAQINVASPDGTKYSLGRSFIIQAAPRPQFRYIGMIARKLGNNDTAYLEEQQGQNPKPYRLNDVVAGRFRLVSIASDRVTVEDVNLGFRYPVELQRTSGTASNVPTIPGRPGSMPRPVNPNSQGIPGIPDGIPRYVPPNRSPNANVNTPRPPRRDDDDDDDDDDPNRR